MQDVIHTTYLAFSEVHELMVQWLPINACVGISRIQILATSEYTPSPNNGGHIAGILLSEVLMWKQTYTDGNE